MAEYYYELDKFIEYNEELDNLDQKCKKAGILPSVKGRYTRILHSNNKYTYYLEKTDNYYNGDVISKKEYYNSPQIKRQLLMKALKELK
jgi:hypothetical protein